MISPSGIADRALAFCSPAASPRNQTASNIVERRLLQIWDAATVFVAGILCAAIYRAIQPNQPILAQPPEGFITIAMRISLVAALVAPVAFVPVRAPVDIKGWPGLIKQTITHLSVLIGALLAIGFSTRALIYVPRTWALIWSASIALSVPIGRLLILRLRDHASSRNMLRQKIVIAGRNTAADALDRHLSNKPGLGMEVTRVFRYFDEGSLQDCLADLIDYGKHHVVDRVLLAPGEQSDPTQLQGAVEQLKALSADVALCPYLIESVAFQPELIHVGDVPFVLLAPRPLGLLAVIAKTIVDKVLAAILITLHIPLMIVIAIAIRLDSPGPVLFRQKRYGLNNAEFEIWKFRTMIAATAAPGEQLRQTERSDARLTRIGQFLRRTSLDELPQLFNVLRGEMSLVGPRPHPTLMRTEGRLGAEIVNNYPHRHRVKPGMTGWAQINGSRGATGTMEQIRRRIELDMFYIEHWSIFLDLKILAMTPVVMFLKNDNAF